MKELKVVIVGNGHVGAGMQQLFPDAVVVDPPKGIGSYLDAGFADLAIVCVPTPCNSDGSCNTSIVTDAVLQLIEVKAQLILIKSTVAPSFTQTLSDYTGASIVFSPEYMGEGKYWVPNQYPQPRDPKSHGFVVLGGSRENCSAVADMLLPVLGPATRFRFMTSTEAELVKYAENSYLALKVTFANELRRLCDVADVNYHVVREGWLDDPRVGPMHSAAFKRSPGFDGKCLPKDLSALAAWCRTRGHPSTLLEAILTTNQASSK